MTFDPRKHFNQTQLHFVIGFVVLLIIVGFGLIYLFYGQYAAYMGIVCVAVSVIPIVGVYFILKLIERLVKKLNDE